MKIMEIIMSFQVCLITRMNINYKENGEKKAFLANPKHQCHASQWGEYDCSKHNKKNIDYYKHLSLTHVMNQY